MRPDVEVHIDRLVLRGGPWNDAPAIGAAVERELAARLGSEGAPDHWSTDLHIDRIDAGSVVLRQAGSAAVGRQLAVALHRGMGS